MNIFIAFGLFCHFILASHTENNSINVKNEFENLLTDPLYEIMDRLDQKDKERLSKTSKEFYKYDPREVVLNLPLTKSKEPTPFVCQHLKIRKKLFIAYSNTLLFGLSALDLKYFECLSGVESLRLDPNANYNLLAQSKFKLFEYFPNLKDLEFRFNDKIPLNDIPTNLKSLKLYCDYDCINSESLEEKISQMYQLETMTLQIVDYTSKISSPFSQMISQLKHLPKFKRLVIKYQAGLVALRDILHQTENADYVLDLEVYFDIKIENHHNIFEFLPATTEALNLHFYEFENTQRFCSRLLTLNRLKKLIMKAVYYRQTFDCLLQSLPPSLTDLTYDGYLDSFDFKDIALPKGLHKVTLEGTNSKVFELLANYVPDLNLNINDHENLLKIKKPFTRVENLILKIFTRFEQKKIDALKHVLDLLPIDMENVDLRIILEKEEEISSMEQKILSLDKRIKRIVFSGEIWSNTNGKEWVVKLLYTEKSIKRQLNPNYWVNAIEREYIFDGTKMIRKN